MTVVTVVTVMTVVTVLTVVTGVTFFVVVVLFFFSFVAKIVTKLKHTNYDQTQESNWDKTKKNQFVMKLNTINCEKKKLLKTSRKPCNSTFFVKYFVLIFPPCIMNETQKTIALWSVVID